MLCGYHLRKVNDDRVSVVCDHDVKLVKISVNDPVVRELQQKVHEAVVQKSWIVYLIADMARRLRRMGPSFRYTFLLT